MGYLRKVGCVRNGEKSACYEANKKSGAKISDDFGIKRAEAKDRFRIQSGAGSINCTMQNSFVNDPCGGNGSQTGAQTSHGGSVSQTGAHTSPCGRDSRRGVAPVTGGKSGDDFAHGTGRDDFIRGTGEDNSAQSGAKKPLRYAPPANGTNEAKRQHAYKNSLLKKQRQKRRKRKLRAAAILCLLALTAGFLGFRKNAKTVVTAVAESRVRAMTTTCVNLAVYDTLAGVSYTDLVTAEKNASSAGTRTDSRSLKNSIENSFVILAIV